ncbi:LAQU0S02e01662g1_1 [Lachancea quebecensis]|uniref:LAQU0S02e01662g1_1 n=1 Tax=Lachancea quebecensis TaxID=1654605 RepID=A0A0P1KN37_9SACH|nr:LAQU0S02e01662g1_1 [Lachancea quebecensis]
MNTPCVGETPENPSTANSSPLQRLKGKSGSIFKPRQDSPVYRQNAIRHDQILIWPRQPSPARSTDEPTDGVVNLSTQRVVDNFLILGATGLTGSLILANMVQPWIYLNATRDLQNKVDSIYPADAERFARHNIFVKKPRSPLCNILVRRKSIDITKNLYCLARRPVTVEDVPLDGLDDSWEHEIRCKGFDLFCAKGDISRENALEQSATMYQLVGTNKCPGRVINVQLQSFSFKLAYRNSRDSHGDTCGHTLMVRLNINIICVIDTDSQRWPVLLTDVFGEQPRKRELISHETQGTLHWEFPSLGDVSTLVSALGSTRHQERKSSIPRHYVDYELNLTLAQEFCQRKTPGTKKKIVIVTSFNSSLLTTVSNYFQTKLKLEQDLYSKVHGMDNLVLLRPGPLVGNHTPRSQIHSVTNRPSFLPVTLFNILILKKRCFDRKVKLVRDLMKIGLRAKLSELGARIAYQRPCLQLIGNVNAVDKVAFVAATRAICCLDSASFVELIKSDEIEKMAK